MAGSCSHNSSLVSNTTDVVDLVSPGLLAVLVVLLVVLLVAVTLHVLDTSVPLVWIVLGVHRVGVLFIFLAISLSHAF